jgi:hypothetical protein
MGKYTYEDWLNVKVVLVTTKGIPNEVSTENIVSIDDFDVEEAKKINENQKSVFNNLLDREFNKIKNEFYSKIENSQFPKILIKREVESLKALIGNKFICEDGVCRSPIKGDNKTFLDWYYWSMMNHKNNSIINGIVCFYDEIPSTKSRFYENGRIPPEVMISAVLKTYSFIRRLNKNPNSQNKIKDLSNISYSGLNQNLIENSKSADITDYSTRDSDTTSNNQEWKKYFSEQIAYDLFLDCVEKLPNTGRTDNSIIVKYALIYHFFQDNNLILNHINHKAFMLYLEDEHEIKFSDNTSAFPKSRSLKNDLAIQLLFKERFPSRKVK